MLQYPVQLPPLSQKISVARDHDYVRPNDLPIPQQLQQNLPASILNRKRLQQKDPLISRPVLSSFHHPQPLSPLSISTNLPSSIPPSPSFTSPNLPRSPYLSSRQLPLTTPLPIPSKDFLKPPSDAPSVASQVLEDVLVPGDVIGEGFLLQGEVVRLVSDGAPNYHHREPAQEFEVIKQLGTGSYAVVYLVQEVLSRPPASEDGHMSTIGLMELDNHPVSSPPHVTYGRKYAIKCLSKANLDEEALAIQMSEVCTILTSSIHTS